MKPKTLSVRIVLLENVGNVIAYLSNATVQQICENSGKYFENDLSCKS